MDFTELRRFTKPYSQIGLHRKKCRICKQLIQDGDSTLFIQGTENKWYPIKGIMTFPKLLTYHEACEYIE